MDSSLQSAHLTADDLETSVATLHEEAIGAEEEPHIHLPNASLWPLILGIAILVTVMGLLFIPDNPWLTIIGAPFILVGILGWALEDPMAAPKEHFYTSQDPQARFQIGQTVLDRGGSEIGLVQARFGHYLLVDSGLFARAFYVPHRFILDDTTQNVVRLKVTQEDLLVRGLDRVPDDLYDDEPDYGVPTTNGVPQFARRPLSPAETGHYNYGPNYPGINTDAGGSFLPEEVRPAPQRYVSDRRNFYANRKPGPPQAASAN